MKKTNIELPDGRLLTIEGANAAQVANIVQNRLVTTASEGEETALPLPTLNFDKSTPEPVITESDEAALPLPSLY